VLLLYHIRLKFATGKPGFALNFLPRKNFGGIPEKNMTENEKIHNLPIAYGRIL
jgi:hypothetical protein